MNDNFNSNNQDDNLDKFQKSTERQEMFSLPPLEEQMHKRDFTWNQAPPPPTANSDSNNSSDSNSEQP